MPDVPAPRLTVPEDILRFAVPSEVRLSPDGSRFVYALKTVDEKKNRYHTHLWVGETDGDAPPRQWTHGQGSESDGQWSPDGAYLLFKSAREEKLGQLYLLPTSGGEAQKLTDLPAGSIGEAAWSPDSSRIAYTFRPQDEAWTDKAVEERKKNHKSNPARVITRRHYRMESEGFVPSAPYQLFVLDLATRETVQLTNAETGRDIGSFCWSPDGNLIAFVQNTAPSPDVMPGHREVFTLPATKTGDGYDVPQRLNAPPGPKSNLAWSPDGKYIAYLGHDRPGETWGVGNIHAWIAATDNSGARDLMSVAGFYLTCGNIAIGDMAGSGDSGPIWSPDNQSVYVLVSERGNVDVNRIRLDGGFSMTTEGEHAVVGFSLAVNRLAVLVCTPTDAGDVYIGVADGEGQQRTGLIRRTETNRELLKELQLPSPRYFETTAPDDKAVACWACLPPDFADNPSPRPTILYIHGGPHLMYAHALFHEYQALAAQGFVVLYPNPRGSKGYGEQWTGAIKGNWGDPAMADCLACVDYAIAQGWTNGERLGVAGGSYGGYLTGWIVGQTNRFKAAVAERGVYNLVSMAGTCDFTWRDSLEGENAYFRANTTNSTDEYRRNSPLTYADRVQTPLLLIHSEGDLRCPVSQAEEYFSALVTRGADVTFVRYGTESNHNLSRGGPPDQRIDRQHRIAQFFKNHLG